MSVKQVVGNGDARIDEGPCSRDVSGSRLANGTDKRAAYEAFLAIAAELYHSFGTETCTEDDGGLKLPPQSLPCPGWVRLSLSKEGYRKRVVMTGMSVNRQQLLVRLIYLLWCALFSPARRWFVSGQTVSEPFPRHRTGVSWRLQQPRRYNPENPWERDGRADQQTAPPMPLYKPGRHNLWLGTALAKDAGQGTDLLVQ